MSDLKYWGLLGIHVLFIAVIYALSYGGISQFSVENWVMIFTALMLMLGTVTSLYLGEEVSPKIFRNAFILMAIESLALPLLFLWPYLVSSTLKVVANSIGSPEGLVQKWIASYEYCLLSGLSGLAMMGLSRWYPFKKQPWQRWVMPLLFWAIFLGILWVRLYYFVPNGKKYTNDEMSAIEIRRYMYSFSYWVPALFITSGIMLAIRGMLSTSVQWLYWKEWREQRWTLLGCMLLFLLPRFYEVLPYLLLFYLVFAGTRFLGADSGRRTFPYLMTRPFNRNHVFGIRISLGLFMVLLFVSLCVYAVDLGGSWGRLNGFLISIGLLTLGVILYFLSALSSILFMDRIKSLILSAICVAIGAILLSLEFLPGFSISNCYNVYSVNIIHFIYGVAFLFSSILITVSVLYLLFTWRVYMKWVFHRCSLVVLAMGFCFMLISLFLLFGDTTQEYFLAPSFPLYGLSSKYINVYAGKMYYYQTNISTPNNMDMNVYTGRLIYKTPVYEVQKNAQGKIEYIPFFFGGMKGESLPDIDHCFLVKDQAYIGISEPTGLRISRFNLAHSNPTSIRILGINSDGSPEKQTGFYTTFRVLEPVKEKEVVVNITATAKSQNNIGPNLVDSGITVLEKTESVLNTYKEWKASSAVTTWSADSQGFLINDVQRLLRQDCVFLTMPDLDVFYQVKGSSTQLPIYEVIQINNKYFVGHTKHVKGFMNQIEPWNIFSLSTGNKPALIAKLPLDIASIVSDPRGYLYIGRDSYMFSVIDIRDISNIKTIANIPYPWYQRGIPEIYDNMIYYDSQRKAVIVCWSNSVQVIDVKNPEKPVVKGGPVNIRKNGDFYEYETLIDSANGCFYRIMGELIQRVDYKAILNKNRG